MTLGHYFSCLNDMCTSHQATVLFHIHVMHVMDLMYIHNVSDTVRLDRNITPQITHLYSLFLSLSVYLYVPCKHKYRPFIGSHSSPENKLPFS